MAMTQEQREWADARNAAGNARTNPEELAKLSGHGDCGIRAAVAFNGNTPEAILRKLAGDSDWNVRYAVGRSPNTPKDVLEELAKDADVCVQIGAMDNKNLSAETRTKLKNRFHFANSRL